mgnify:CR=1 FL=1|jgi:hypothetical protein
MILDPPNTRLWAERLTWFDRRLRPDGMSRPVSVGAQSEALLHECRRAFASGGWVTVVVLAQAVIDSELAERLVDGSGDGLDLNEARFGRDFVWLRARRNGYLHNDGPGPAITAHELLLDAQRLEREARKAVELLAKVLSGS